jgi:hypothetical protein
MTIHTCFQKTLPSSSTVTTVYQQRRLCAFVLLLFFNRLDAKVLFLTGS